MRWGLLACFVLSLGGGCRSLDRSARLPTKTALKNPDFRVQTDLRLPKNHPLFQDLVSLKDRVHTELNLPAQKQQVVIYVFADKGKYQDYLATAYPQLPPRPAYFVGTPQELSIYTYWGEHIQEDVRHETTHGILHATLKDVPLWLDEGLAEYFEIAGPAGELNPEYSARLAVSIENGWRPNLHRLEQLETVGQMQRADYQESWAWVHFMLHHSEDTRGVLLSYLEELRERKNVGPLSDRLVAAVPNCEERFLSYVATFPATGVSKTASGSNHVLPTSATE